MEFTNAIEINDLTKKFKGFTLNIPHCRIPKGFATAVIGENGAGKTTLLNILSGLRLDHKGNVQYFDQKETNVDKVKNLIGYTGQVLFSCLTGMSDRSVRSAVSYLQTFSRSALMDSVRNLGSPRVT